MSLRWLFGVAAFVLFIASEASAAASSFAAEILAAHNAIRSRVGVPRLVWSDRLAAAAQRWADTLVKRNQFAHDPKSPYGENLFAVIGGTASPAEIVEEWASEEKNYDRRTNSCRGECGHYTQVVWRNTRELGCAVARRGNREICVCEYDPPGNFNGQRPY